MLEREMALRKQFFYFIQHNNLIALKNLLKSGFNLKDPELVDAFGKTPLYLAAITEGENMLIYLLKIDF